ncbi:MAG: hypothetical protein ACREC6_02125 [Hyphomicrobiaceae bacterium]
MSWHRSTVLGSIVTLCLAAGMTSVSAPAEAGCTVFQHRDFGGSSFHLAPGDSLQMAGEPCGRTQSHGRPRGRIHYHPSWNDQISSFKVTADCTITLWQHASGCGGSGARFVRTNRLVRYIGDNWNDQASHVECSCR